ncbi:MAG: hypothetical protein ABIR46_03125 [Candidatus Saccharimonadales bacterium]
MEHWEIEKLVDGRIKTGINDYDKKLAERLKDMFTIRLSKYETFYAIGKWLAGAVVLLLIGTIYQIFVSLASKGVG